MADERSASFGKVAFVDAGGRSAGTCVSAMLDRALAELREIAGRDKHYAKLRLAGLDEDRLRFYQLCMHLDLVAGPLRIAGTGHPEREWFRGLAERHLQRVLHYPT